MYQRKSVLLTCVIILPPWNSVKHSDCLQFSSVDNTVVIQLDRLDVVLSFKFLPKCFMVHLRQAKSTFGQFTLTELTTVVLSFCILFALDKI